MNNKINIALLSYYSGTVNRGVETIAKELAARLGKKFNVTIFHGSGEIATNAKNKSYKFSVSPPVTAKNIFAKLYLNPESLKIFIFSLKILPDILTGKYGVIFALNGGWQTAIYRIVTKIIGAKLIITGQAGIGSDESWNLFFRPDIFVAPTREEKKWAEKIAPEVDISYIPNGVDLSRFHPKVKPVKINLPKPIVICASALDPYKQVDRTIKAVSKTKELSLLVLGDGELKGKIDSLGKRMLGKRYLRLAIPHEQMASYYKTAKLFSLASKTEAFGIAYIEAMACNLPVVTTNDNSREEIIGNAGILTNPQDIDQYAKDLEIASKTNYRNIPYSQSLKFSWNKVAFEYSNLIKKLVG